MGTRAILTIAKSILLAAAFGIAGLLLVDVATQWWKDAQPEGAIGQVLFGGVVGVFAGVTILAVYLALEPALSALAGKHWGSSQGSLLDTKATPPVDSFDLFRKGFAGLLLLLLSLTALLAPYVSTVFARFARITTILVVLILWLGGGIAMLLQRRKRNSSSTAFRWNLRSRPLYLRASAVLVCCAVAAGAVWSIYALVVGNERPGGPFVVVGLVASVLLAIILYDLPAPTAPRSVMRDGFRS